MAKKKLGAPPKYDQTTRDEICAALAEGRSLRSICRQEGMPSIVLVLRWLREEPAFVTQYVHAREAQADALAEEILEIADNASNDWMEREDPENPGFSLNGEHIQRSKLRVDARKWWASKVAPKKYGDKVEQTLKGEVAVRNVRIAVEAAQWAPRSPDDASGR
jgi:hypothetical protein